MAAQPKDLIDFIDFRGLEVLNQVQGGSEKAIKQGYRDQDDLMLVSDSDEQLLINMPFTQKVNIQSIIIKGPADSGPKHVKLFVNKMNMGFSNADSAPSSQDLDLSPAQLAGEPVPLKFVKFQHVTLLTIFVVDNQDGSEATSIQKIAVLGQSGEVFNVAEIKKQEEKK